MWNNPWDALEKEYEQEYGVAITEVLTFILHLKILKFNIISESH